MSENGPRNFVESKEQTIKDFRLIKPMIEYAVRQFEGFPVIAKSNEERETEAAIQSDLTCGNDVCIFTLDTMSLVCNVASRIQPNKNFRSFTIRSMRESGTKTEFEKRLFEINHGLIYPKYTCQAYKDKKTHNIESFALMRTKDLIKDVIERDHLFEWKKTKPDQIGQAWFKTVYWDKMIRKHKYDIVVWDRSIGYYLNYLGHEEEVTA